MQPTLTPRAIEARSPFESLTVYRALVVCHMAGAVFALLGLALNPDAIAGPFRAPTLVAAGAQLIIATWLLFHPAWVPRLILSAPRLTLAFSCTIAAFYLLPAVNPLAPPTVTITFAWISTAAAVLPPRGWPIVGAVATGVVGAIWALSGFVGSAGPVVAGSIVLGALGFLPGAVNAAWMGATGSVLARRIRRWGLVIGHEDGALSALRSDARDINDAAEDLLKAGGADLGQSGTIALGTLRHAAVSASEDDKPLTQHLRELVAPLRPPFTIDVRGDERAHLSSDEAQPLDDALLRHLTNVMIHAPLATAVDIEVRATEARGIRIAVEDNGGGTAPRSADEGEGTGISRSALAAIGGELRYERGITGVRLLLEFAAPPAASELPLPSLTTGLRSFIGTSLRNNRLATYVSPIPFLAFGTTGLLWSVPLLLLGGIAIELAFRRAGPSGEQNDIRFLLLGAGIATAMTAVFAVALSGSDPFVPSAATAYPIVELAWRGLWRWWLVGELLRAACVGIWLHKAGPGGLGGAYVLPLALTLIAVGGRRLVMRAQQVEERVGDAIVRRRTAAHIAQQAALRHDVVDQLAGHALPPEATTALARLDAATRRLAARSVPSIPVVEDLLTGIKAAAAPTPLRIVDRRTQRPPAETLPTALELERRLIALELGATAGGHLVAWAPPRWSGRPRLEALLAELDDDAGGGTQLRLSPIGEISQSADATALASVELADLSTAGLAAEADGREITITVRTPVGEAIRESGALIA